MRQYVFNTSREDFSKDNLKKTQGISLIKSILYIVFGIIGLFFGGKWFVNGAINIARVIGMSDAFIGSTVVAAGTSLPELVTSATASYRKNTDIAVGNVIGSNIFNVFWVLGISAVIKPLPFDIVSNYNIVMLIFSSYFFDKLRLQTISYFHSFTFDTCSFIIILGGLFV